MADLKVRNLDDQLVAVLKAQARHKGISLDEEIRRTLAAPMQAERDALGRRAAALRAAAGGKPGRPELDSARVIRAGRDAWG